MQVNHIVAPFHHAPDYALAAMAEAGYTACVGGVLNVYPEFILARSGRVSSTHKLVGHSQQSMLHGHTVRTAGDKLTIFKEAFDLSQASGAWYGFLDHPFSSRYNYDWPNEPERSDCHAQFINYITSNSKVLFTNQNSCLEFWAARAKVRMHQDGTIIFPCKLVDGLQFAYRQHGKTFAVQEGPA